MISYDDFIQLYQYLGFAKNLESEQPLLVEIFNHLSRDNENG